MVVIYGYSEGMSKDEDFKENMELAEANKRGNGKGIGLSVKKHSPLLLASNCSRPQKKVRSIELSHHGK